MRVDRHAAALGRPAEPAVHEGLEPGESPTLATNGVGFTIRPGLELSLGKGLALDVGAFWTWYHTKAYDLAPIGRPPVSDGQEYGVRVGLAWQPFVASALEAAKAAPPVDPATGKLLPLPPPDAARDAWGVRRSWGWATAQMLAINFGASMINEYVRDANFYQISPRSFWANLKEGFTYDDNEFKTNQLIHPWNGAAYFNAGRVNGIGFWGSSALAMAGAFVWECCGETHPMSFNDMISTGIGGIARGEAMYRISSLILDNRKRGKARVGHEAAALLVNPVRGFNRVVSGDASEVKGNPVHPWDWRPPFQLHVLAGPRIVGEGESISENTNTYGFLEVALSYGDPWDPENRRPYDRFDVVSQSNFGDKTRLGRLLIRGDLVSKLVGENHSLALQQNFDYVDNEAYEYGGQSLGPARYSHIVVSNGSIYNGEVAGARLGLDADHDIHQVQLKLDVPITRSLSVGADGSVFLRRSRYDVTESDFTGLPPGRQTITQRTPRSAPTWPGPTPTDRRASRRR